MWNGTHNFLDLINGRCPREKRLAQEHLSQDAAYAPHVHTFRVSAGYRGLSYDTQKLNGMRFFEYKFNQNPLWSMYLVDPRRISGALYHRVATYSVKAGLTASSWFW